MKRRQDVALEPPAKRRKKSISKRPRGAKRPRDDRAEERAKRPRPGPHDPNERCAICLERSSDFLTACGHEFHYECVACLDQCPVCRRPFYDDADRD